MVSNILIQSWEFNLLFWGFVFFIKVCGWVTYSVLLCEDSSSTVLREALSSILWIRPLFLVVVFIHCLRADSSTLISGDLSCLISVDSFTVAYKAWLYGCQQFFVCLFGFILASEGSCCVDCLSDRLSLPLLFFFPRLVLLIVPFPLSKYCFG